MDKRYRDKLYNYLGESVLGKKESFDKLIATSQEYRDKIYNHLGESVLGKQEAFNYLLKQDEVSELGELYKEYGKSTPLYDIDPLIQELGKVKKRSLEIDENRLNEALYNTDYLLGLSKYAEQKGEIVELTESERKGGVYEIKDVMEYTPDGAMSVPKQVYRDYTPEEIKTIQYQKFSPETVSEWEEMQRGNISLAMQDRQKDIAIEKVMGELPEEEIKKVKKNLQERFTLTNQEAESGTLELAAFLQWYTDSADSMITSMLKSIPDDLDIQEGQMFEVATLSKDDGFPVVQIKINNPTPYQETVTRAINQELLKLQQEGEKLYKLKTQEIRDALGKSQELGDYLGAAQKDYNLLNTLGKDFMFTTVGLAEDVSIFLNSLNKGLGFGEETQT